MSARLTTGNVLIIGAGLGGLVLAQCLRKAGVPCEVFERDTSVGTRNQGWAVSIIEALPYFHTYLPSDLGDLHKVSVNYGTNDEDGFAVLDGETSTILTKFGNKPDGQPGHMVRASRQLLREYLWKGVGVHTGKYFDYYEEDDDGVTVYFKDGTSSRGSILIGADGSHSHLRNQLLKGVDCTPSLSSMVPIVGEVKLTKDQFGKFRDLATAGIVVGKGPVRCFIAVRSIEHDLSSAQYYWSINLSSDNSKTDSDWVQNATRQELLDKARECATGIAIMQDIISLTSPEGMLLHPYKMYEYICPDPLPTGRVTLLGDSAHTMLPLRGAGANTAFADAFDLADLLIDAYAPANVHVDLDHAGWSALLQQYNQKIIPRGRDTVIASSAAAHQMGDLAKVAQRVTKYRSRSPTKDATA